MDTRKVATEYRLAHWAQMVQTRTSRGESIKDFCASEGISKNTYFYWQRKLREAACEMANLGGETGGNLVPPGWAQLTQPISCEPSLTIEINGYRITVTKNTDPDLLAKTCGTLKSL